MMVLPSPVPLTGPLACEREIVPLLKPTRPPTAVLLTPPPVPLAATDALPLPMKPSFRPTSPPTKLLLPPLTVTVSALLLPAPEKVTLTLARLSPPRPPAVFQPPFCPDNPLPTLTFTSACD